jgi:hypothetical protein
MNGRPTKERIAELTTAYSNIKHGTPEDFCLQDCVREIQALNKDLQFFKELITFLDKIDGFWILKEAHDDGYISEAVTSFEELIAFRHKTYETLKRLTEEENE